MSGNALLAAGLARVHRLLPRATGCVYTAMFIDTRGLGDVPDDVCPLGARRVEVADVPRVAAVYVWGTAEPTVLALHGWGTDSTAMSAVVDVVTRNGESVMCFDAPGHGVSPGSQATITEYAGAISAVLQHFVSIHTIVAHSLASIAAVAAVAESDASAVRTVILLAPACSLAGVLDRWAGDRQLPAGVASLISRELE
ncbi:MAG: alpha/beta hydrolase, partial [Mycobacterium sp.]